MLNCQNLARGMNMSLNSEIGALNENIVHHLRKFVLFINRFTGIGWTVQ